MTAIHRGASVIGLAAGMTILAIAAVAEPLPATAPEAAGMSSERLGRLTETFQQGIDQGELPGAVVAVARNGRLVYEKAFGFQNREDKIPMKTGSVFRIASMSKPITSVAVMMLAEEGKIDLAAPASRYLPELKDVKVGADGQPVKRPMTVQDLLRHTSGFTYGFSAEDPAMVKAYDEAKLFDFGQSTAEMVTKLAKLPLTHQPGTTWDYSMSTDVLGRIVEVASGMGLDQFVQQRITRPLNLTATGFSVGQSQAGNIAEPQVDSATGKRPVMMTDGINTPKWLSGGGGMMSTADDYVRFCQMLLNGGELDGARLLAPKTVALMTSNHLAPNIAYNARMIALLQDMAPTPEMGEGFGLGFLVRTQEGRNPLPGSVGDISWAGAYGTYFWVDPKEKLVAVAMMQNAFDDQGLARSTRYRQKMRYLVYQAIIGPVEAAPAAIR
jgi:CubicO group peptidase (beta-lactamase class C family)